MKKQLITPLVLVLGLTTIAQPSFAMKRSRPGPLEMSFMVESFVSVVGWFWAKHTANPTTFESQSGHRFAVPASNLNAFLQLTPTIANMFSDFEDTGMTIPLSVSIPALYLLTQMASGADYRRLISYIRHLSPSEIETLKEESNFLDSKKLKALICCALHNNITFVSQSGNHFNVPAHDLEELMELSPSIATLLWDLAGSDMSEGIMLDNVHDAALILLTVMAGGVYHPGLPHFIRALSPHEIEELKRDAELLDSQALKTLISQALINPFTELPDDALHEILAKAGPWARSNSRMVSKRFKECVDLVRKPSAKENFGCTDKLPVVATIHVGRNPHQPVTHDQMLYVLSKRDGTLTVINLNSNQVVTTMWASTALQQSFAHGQMHYEANLANGTVKVVDANTDQSVATVQVVGEPQGAAVYGPMLYVMNYGHTVSVVDPDTNTVVATIQVPSPQHGVVHGQILYVTSSWDDSVHVIDTNTNLVIAIIKVGDNPQQVFVHGQMLYVVNQGDGTISVIDIGGYLPGQY